MLNPLFLNTVQKNQRLVFQNSKFESPSRFCIVILNGGQNFKFPGFWYATLIGWILYTFNSGFKYKIRLVSRKREDQAGVDLDIHHSKVFSSVCLKKIGTNFISQQKNYERFLYASFCLTLWLWKLNFYFFNFRNFFLFGGKK